MTEGNRLCHLKVGEAGHDGVGMLARNQHNTRLQTREFRHRGIDFSAKIETQISGNLVVS